MNRDYVHIGQIVRDFWKQLSRWSQETFGMDRERGPAGPLKHLLKEAQEALDATDQAARREEIVDCQFLVFDAARREGMTLDDLFYGCYIKLAKNKLRKWSRPSSNEPVEHIREQDEDRL